MSCFTVNTINNHTIIIKTYFFMIYHFNHIILRQSSMIEQLLRSQYLKLIIFVIISYYYGLRSSLDLSTLNLLHILYHIYFNINKLLRFNFIYLLITNYINITDRIKIRLEGDHNHITIVLGRLSEYTLPIKISAPSIR